MKGLKDVWQVVAVGWDQKPAVMQRFSLRRSYTGDRHEFTVWSL
jgi:hypothetical protein